MHFQGLNRNDVAPAVLLLQDRHYLANWHTRFKACGIEISLSTSDPLCDVARHSARLRAAGLIVVDLSNIQTPVQSVRELRDIVGAHIPIIAIGTSQNLDYARKLRQHGANEYYAHPAALDELIQTARSLMGLESTGAAHGGRMIAVHGLRGGVGASMIAAGLGSVLARQHGRSCACVDLNFNAPAIGSWLGCDEPGRLNELLGDIHRLDHALLDQIKQSPFPQLDVYDGSYTVEHDPHQTGVADISGLRKLVHILGEQHTSQIWRTSPDYPIHPILMEADTCIVVADGSLPSLRSAMNVLTWIRASKPALRTIVVFNQARPHMPLNVEQFTASTGKAPDHIYLYQRKLSDQILSNLPFSNRNHVMYPAVIRLAADLLDLPQAARPWWKGGYR